MRLVIGIATYQRTKKLERCIDSILFSSYADHVKIVVVADNNDYATKDYFHVRFGREYEIDVLVQPKQSFVIGAWNRIVDEYWNHLYLDGFIGLCDDVELSRTALENAVDTHKREFPDGDGVVGFNQDCPGHPEYTFKWFGQTLMGRKFIERYRDVAYQICCPFYKWSHQDEEMYQYANSLGKFNCCENALIHHYHPAFIKEELDSTHKLLRFGSDSPREHDLLLFQDRQKRGVLWGRSWEE